MDLLKVVAAALEGLGGALPNLWAYQPSWYRWAAPAVLGVLIALAFVHRFFGPDHEAISRRLAMEATIKSLVARQFQPAPGELGSVPRLPSKTDSVLLVGSSELVESAGITAQRQALVWHDRSVDFLVLVPFQEGSWAHRSRVHFENGEDPTDVFRSVNIGARTHGLQHVICIGLASRSSAESSADVVALNEGLASDRARNLCSYVASAVGEGPEYWTLPLGYAESVAMSATSESAQRRAVVIGATTAHPSELREGLLKVVRATRLNNVDLSAYSLSAAPPLQRRSIRWGQHSDLVEGPYHDAE